MTVIYNMSIDRADKPWIGDRRLTEKPFFAFDAECIGLPITLQITARVTWSGWPRIARSHTEISLSLSELLHRGTNIAFKL